MKNLESSSEESSDDDEDHFIEIVREKVEAERYFQQVILREKKGPRQLVKPDPTYKSHLQETDKALAWVSSMNYYDDKITSEPKNDSSGFNLLNTILEFKHNEGRKKVKNIYFNMI